MGFFSTILEKLGLKKEETAAAPAPAASTTAPTKPAAPAEKQAAPATANPLGVSAAGAASKPAVTKEVGDDSAKHAGSSAQAAAPKAISEVDVVKQLEQMAAGSGLNWQVSIVDLLKILGIDSSREARNELAKELGCPEELMHDSAKMNVWLHKEVLKQVAQNGGNIPKELLD